MRHEVAREFIKENNDPVFCHRYPTKPCVGGNPGVPCPERGLTSDGSWIARKVRNGYVAVVTLDDASCIEGPVNALRQLGTTPYREGGQFDCRVLHGAFSRLEPGAGKLARRVLRGPGDGNVTRLPA